MSVAVGEIFKQIIGKINKNKDKGYDEIRIKDLKVISRCLLQNTYKINRQI